LITCRTYELQDHPKFKYDHIRMYTTTSTCMYLNVCLKTVLARGLSSSLCNIDRCTFRCMFFKSTFFITRCAVSHPIAKRFCVGNKYSSPRWDSNTYPASLPVNATKNILWFQDGGSTKLSNVFLCYRMRLWRGPRSVVGIATGYGLDGPGIESQWGGGEIFRTCPDRP